MADSHSTGLDWQFPPSVLRVRLIAHGSLGAHWLGEARAALAQAGARTLRLVEVEQRPDLILIVGAADWAEAFVLEFRRAGDPRPVLALNPTSAGGSSARILDAGADDCLGCPFDSDELLARIQAVIRRQKPALVRSCDVGADRSTRRIRVRDVEARVSRKQFDIFVHLAQHQERWVHSDEIIAAVFGTHHEPATTVVRVKVCALRKALGRARACIRCDGHRSYMLTLARD